MDIIPHPTWTYKPPRVYTHGGEKCDSGISADRLLERGDHACDARLHLTDRRGGNAHRARDLRAAVARIHEPAVYLPRLLRKRRLREDVFNRSAVTRKVPDRHVVVKKRGRRRAR